jgi:transcriptional regulator with XRE-family HTH domain
MIYIGDVIKKWRKVKQLSQQELAFRSQIDRSYISGLERNLCCPSVYTALKLAKGFDICPGQFMIEIHSVVDFDRIFENNYDLGIS